MSEGEKRPEGRVVPPLTSPSSSVSLIPLRKHHFHSSSTKKTIIFVVLKLANWTSLVVGRQNRVGSLGIYFFRWGLWVLIVFFVGFLGHYPEMDKSIEFCILETLAAAPAGVGTDAAASSRGAEHAHTVGTESARASRSRRRPPLATTEHPQLCVSRRGGGTERADFDLAATAR